jgi:MATE family multidrug resistance protein
MPMIAALVENVVNVALVWFLLIVLGGGVAQVAWATTLAQCSEALALIWMQRKHGFGLRGWSAADLRLLMKLGGPLGLERFFDVASFSLMIALFARMGDQELASHQVANQALLFTFMPSMALGEANCVLIGQAVGAGSLRTVPRIQRAALLVCFVYIAACSCAFSCFGAQLAGLFTFDPALTERAAGLFRIAGVFVWVVPFYQVGQSSLRGIGDVRSAAWITVIAAWFCTPLLAAVFGFGFGLGARGGWVGLGTELGLAGLCFWARWRSGESWLWRARRVRARLRTGSRRGNDTPANPAGSEDVDVPTRLSTPPLEAAG